VIQPSLVIVYFGGNDSTHPHPSGHGPHVPLSEFIENMRKIGEHLLVKFVTFFFASSFFSVVKLMVSSCFTFITRAFLIKLVSFSSLRHQ